MIPIDDLTAEQKISVIEEDLGDVMITGSVSYEDLDNYGWSARVDHCEVLLDGLLSSIWGYGASPREAVSDLFKKIVAVQEPRWIVMMATGEDRRQLRWNGRCFQEVR